MELVDKSGRSGFASIWKAVALLMIGACVFSIGCKGSETIWSAEVRSPDGKLIASARTIAQSGFGTGYIGTIVYLNWTKGSQSPREILGLTDESEAPAATGVEMKWLAPTHLELKYKSSQTIDFQAVKYAGIDISVREMPSAASNLPQ